MKLYKDDLFQIQKEKKYMKNIAEKVWKSHTKTIMSNNMDS